VFEVMNESKEHKRMQDQMVDAIVKEIKGKDLFISKIYGANEGDE